VEAFQRFHREDLRRRFAYRGTAGDRNQHVMSGRNFVVCTDPLFLNNCGRFDLSVLNKRSGNSVPEGNLITKGRRCLEPGLEGDNLGPLLPEELKLANVCTSFFPLSCNKGKSSHADTAKFRF
jgi:hypothetical protein